MHRAELRIGHKAAQVELFYFPIFPFWNIQILEIYASWIVIWQVIFFLNYLMLGLWWIFHVNISACPMY